MVFFKCQQCYSSRRKNPRGWTATVL